MATENKKDWYEANQHYLAASLQVLQEELKAYSATINNTDNNGVSAQAISEAKKELEKATLDLPASSSLDSITNIFGLSSFERKLLLLCAGVEFDTNFSTTIATLQGSSSFVRPTFGLAMAAFSDAHWSAIAPHAPLRYWHLINIDTDQLLTRTPLKIDEQIMHYLAGVSYMDERLSNLTTPVFANYHLTSSQLQLADAMLQTWMRNNSAAMPALHLSGSNGADKAAIAAFACANTGLSLHKMAVFAIPGTLKETGEFTRLWNREAALHARALLLDCTGIDTSDKLRVQSIISFIENIQGALLIVTDGWKPELKRRIIEFEISTPTSEEQLQLWKRAMGEKAIRLNGALDKIVANFNLSTTAIEAAGNELIYREKDVNDSNTTAHLEKQIWKTCCIYTRPKVEELAQRIQSVATWEDIVLPEVQQQILKEITAQVKHRKKVYNDWGFAGKGRRGLGISALFAGESGTGKTMAAEVLANELQLDLYRIDLSQVVNKYIGETEKNLKRIFDAAEGGGAILLFDEADALFGKRSDVKDSHDRYSNIEISYLLQRMEEYSGLAILTTNLRSAIDKAFLRRIRFVVQFPYPDAAHRAAIWKRIFPATTPLRDIDIEKLSRLNIPGGNIRNIALNAAFIAADENVPVQMSHISRAARSEYTKIEKSVKQYRNRRMVMQQQIELHIEELVLHGFNGANAHEIGDVVQREISRLLQERGLPANFRGDLQIDRLNAGNFTLSSPHKAATVGNGIASSVYNGLGK